MIPKFRFYSKRMNKIGIVISLKPLRNRVYVEWDDTLSGTENIDDNGILMQSIGMFDDSTPKKEILEGDIVETIYNGELFTGVIVYDQEETGFKATNGRNEYCNNFCYLGGNDSIIVIGNIYQNPELLREAENDTDV